MDFMACLFGFVWGWAGGMAFALWLIWRKAVALQEAERFREGMSRCVVVNGPGGHLH